MRKDILRGGQRKYLQLQNNNIPNTAYLHKIITAKIFKARFMNRSSKSKGNKFKVVVKWKGHPADELNSWIDKNELIACY